MNEYGLRWHQFARNGDMVCKEKFFNDEETRLRYAQRLSQRDSFVEFVSWSDPLVTIH